MNSLPLSAWLVALTAALFAFLWWKRKQNFALFKKLGIPGPEPHFLYGNAVELFRDGIPIVQKRWHEKYGPVVGYFMGIDPYLLVADIDMLKQILVKDFTSFVDRPALYDDGAFSNSLINLKGQQWKHVRSTLTPSFTSSKLKQVVPLVSSGVDDFIKNVDSAHKRDGKADFYELYEALTLDAICKNAMGVDFQIQKELGNSEMLKQFKTILNVDMSFFIMLALALPWTLRNWLAAVTQRLLRSSMNKGADPVTTSQEKCDQIIRFRKASPNNRRSDLLQLMIDAQGSSSSNVHSFTAGEEAENFEATQKNDSSVFSSNSKKLTQKQIVHNAFQLLLAGYETTSSALAFITRMLLRFPDDQEKVREELMEATNGGTVFEFEKLQRCQFLEAFIQETMRMYPPVHTFTNRKAIRDQTINGIKIPANTAVVTSTTWLHYDEEIFPNPNEFRPSRFLPENKTAAMSFAWQPFGVGPRNCIGMRFAQMEMKFTLAKLLTKYRLESSLEPKGNSHVEMTMNSIFNHIKDPLICEIKAL